MYKVFYNKKPIFLTTDIEEIFDDFPLFYAKYTSVYSLMKALKSKKVSGINLYHSKREKLDMHFLKLFPIVEAAGGLVEHKDGRFLFIYRNDKWDLPKGKIQKKETVLYAAMREVSEETGVFDLIVSKPLPTTFHIFKSNGRYKLKSTNWFLMKTKHALPLTPQADENIQKAEWKTIDEIPSLLKNAYENIKVVINAVVGQ